MAVCLFTSPFMKSGTSYATSASGRKTRHVKVSTRQLPANYCAAERNVRARNQSVLSKCEAPMQKLDDRHEAAVRQL
eukprot:307604-Chlamydomonas_euryale.AAC.2